MYKVYVEVWRAYITSKYAKSQCEQIMINIDLINVFCLNKNRIVPVMSMFLMGSLNGFSDDSDFVWNAKIYKTTEAALKFTHTHRYSTKNKFINHFQFPPSSLCTMEYKIMTYKTLAR